MEEQETTQETKEKIRFPNRILIDYISQRTGSAVCRIVLPKALVNEFNLVGKQLITVRCLIGKTKDEKTIMRYDFVMPHGKTLIKKPK
jgi:hypothetical protein